MNKIMMIFCSLFLTLGISYGATIIETNNIVYKNNVTITNAYFTLGDKKIEINSANDTLAVVTTNGTVTTNNLVTFNDLNNVTNETLTVSNVVKVLDSTSHNVGLMHGTPSGANNTYLGYDAGIGGGSDSVAIGERAGGNNSSDYSVSIGNITRLFSTGNKSTAIGWAALFNANGDDNTAVGYLALNGAAGVDNTGVGIYAGSGATGNYNTHLGSEAGRNAVGNNNTYIGRTTGYSTTGDYNTSLGESSLYNYSGNGNMAIGQTAMESGTGSYNTAIGYSAGRYVSGASNTLIGVNSGYNGVGQGYTNATTIGANVPIKGNNTVNIGRPSDAVYVDGRLYTDGSNVTNVNAAFLNGYTATQIKSVGVPYYVWGSLTGEYSNVATKMAKIESPVAMGIYTSQVSGASVTNGMYLGFVSVKQSELSRLLDVGISTVHISIERTGSAAERYMQVYMSIYENDQTTLVQTFTGDSRPVPTTKSHVDYDISVTNTVNLTDSSRWVVVYFRLISGWGVGGGETISVYSQDGELTYLTLSSAAQIGARGATSIKTSGGTLGSYDESARQLTLPSVITTNGGAMNGVGVTNLPLNSGFTLSTAYSSGQPQETTFSDNSMVFSNATRSFTISPVGANFRFTINNEKWYEYSTPQQVIIDDVEGVWYIYFRKSNGTLIATQTAWTIEGEAQVAVVYWDSLNKRAVWVNNERHGNTIDDAYHRYHHFDPNEGTHWQSGGVLYANPLATTAAPSTTGSNTVISINPVTISDEDIYTYIDSNRQNLGSQASPTFTNSGAQLTSIYCTGAIGSVCWRTNSCGYFPFMTNTVGNIGRPQYNFYNGTRWVTNDVPEDNYFVYYVIAVNTATNAGIYVMPWTTTYTTLTNAQAQATPNNLFLNRTPYPAAEIKPLYRLIFLASYAAGTAPAYSALVSYSKLQDTTDYRIGSLSPILGGSVSAVSHGSLLGLNNDDHPQYLLTDGSRINITTNNISVSFSSSSTNNLISSIARNNIDIVRGRMYISNTNGLTAGTFSQTAELTIANTGLIGSGRALSQYDAGMVCVLFTNDCPAGATNIVVQDNSGFDINSLLYLMGSNEFVRVQSISSTTNLILKFPTLYGHGVTNGCSRVREFGNIDYYDSTYSNVLYTTTIFPSATTVNLNLDIEYR